MQAAVQKEADVLLALKKQFKELTGKDYAPPSYKSKDKGNKGKSEQKQNKKEDTSKTMPPVTQEVKLSPEAEDLLKKITEQGDTVRGLKTSSAPKV